MQAWPSKIKWRAARLKANHNKQNFMKIFVLFVYSSVISTDQCEPAAYVSNTADTRRCVNQMRLSIWSYISMRNEGLMAGGLGVETGTYVIDRDVSLVSKQIIDQVNLQSPNHLLSLLTYSWISLAKRTLRKPRRFCRNTSSTMHMAVLVATTLGFRMCSSKLMQKLICCLRMRMNMQFGQKGLDDCGLVFPLILSNVLCDLMRKHNF